MTPIGHFTNTCLIAGNAQVTSSKMTNWVFLFYVITMSVLVLWIQFGNPHMNAMHYVDWLGNLASIFVCAQFVRTKNPRLFFVTCMLIGSQLLAGFSHMGDWVMLKVTGAIPLEGMWRPHHLWHTPLFGVIYSFLAALLLHRIVKGYAFKKIFFLIVLGYFAHIVADSITYDFPIFWLWPFSEAGAVSIASAWIPPGQMTGLFGNPLCHFGFTEHNPKWGFTMYVAEIVVNLMLGLMFYVRSTWRSFQEKTDASKS